MVLLLVFIFRAFVAGCFAVDVMVLMLYLCGWCCYWWLAGVFGLLMLNSVDLDLLAFSCLVGLL